MKRLILCENNMHCHVQQGCMPELADFIKFCADAQFCLFAMGHEEPCLLPLMKKACAERHC